MILTTIAAAIFVSALPRLPGQLPGYIPYHWSPYWPEVQGSPASQDVFKATSSFNLEFKAADRDQFIRQLPPNDVVEVPIAYDDLTHQVLHAFSYLNLNLAWNGSEGRKTWTYTILTDTSLMTTTPAFIWTATYQIRAVDTSSYLAIKDAPSDYASMVVLYKWFPTPQPEE